MGLDFDDRDELKQIEKDKKIRELAEKLTKQINEWKYWLLIKKTDTPIQVEVLVLPYNIIGKDMIINIDKIKDYKKKLEHYKGLLPLLLTTYIDNEEYIKNLKKQGIYYDDVQEDIFNRRYEIQFLNDIDLIEYENDELKKWLNENPSFSDVVIDG